MNNDVNKKEKRAKWSKDFKLYNIIMNNFWRFIGTVLIGVCLGYLTTRKSKDDSNYMLFFIILFFVIGVFNFFLSLYKEIRKLEKREKMRKDLENKKNIGNQVEEENENNKNNE